MTSMREIARMNNRLDIYVDANYGDDKNAGTEKKPVKTLVRAEELIPTIVEGPVVVWVKMHSGTGYQSPRVSPRLLKHGSIYFVGVGENVILDESEVTAGGSHMELSFAGMTTDQYRGMTIEVLSGAAAGCRRTIRNNTENTIVPVTHFKAPLAVGDTFRIFEPAVKIDNLPDNEFLENPARGSWVSNCGTVDYALNMTHEANKVFFVNLDFDTSNMLPYFQCSNSSVILLGIKFSKFGVCIANDSCIKAGVESYNPNHYWPSVASVIEDLDVEDQNDWLGWGVSAPEGLLGQIEGYYVGEMYISYGGTHIVGGNLYGGLYVYGNDLTLPRRTIDRIAPWSNGAIPAKISNRPGYPAITCRSGATLDLYKVNIESGEDGIVCYENSNLTIGQGVSVNAQNVGVLVKSGGNISFIVSSSQSLDVQGNLADFSEDNGTTLRNISELTANNAFVDLAHLSKIAWYPYY